MTATITLEQHIEELRAEYRAATSRKELRQIFEELRVHERRLVALEWKAQGQTEAAG